MRTTRLFKWGASALPRNAVIVRGSAAEFESIQAMIAEMDIPPVATTSEDDQPRADRFIELHNASATSVAALIKELMKFQAPRSHAGQLAVVVDQRLNTLVLRGSAASVAEAAWLVARFDAAKEKVHSGGYVFETIVLSHARAAEVSDLIKGLHSPGGNRSPSVRVGVDPRLNAVIVRTRREVLGGIRRLVEQVDVPTCN